MHYFQLQALTIYRPTRISQGHPHRDELILQASAYRGVPPNFTKGDGADVWLRTSWPKKCRRKAPRAFAHIGIYTPNPSGTLIELQAFPGRPIPQQGALPTEKAEQVSCSTSSAYTILHISRTMAVNSGHISNLAKREEEPFQALPSPIISLLCQMPDTPL